MIKTSNRSNFYVDISKADYIPQDVMDIVKREVGRAVKMMPAQDVLDLAINGASKTVNMEDARDAAIQQLEQGLGNAMNTIKSLQSQLHLSKQTNESTQQSANV